MFLVQNFVYDLVTEAIDQPVDGNDRLHVRHIHPTELKKTANTASSTMTRKMD